MKDVVYLESKPQAGLASSTQRRGEVKVRNVEVIRAEKGFQGDNGLREFCGLEQVCLEKEGGVLQAFAELVVRESGALVPQIGQNEQRLPVLHLA